MTQTQPSEKAPIAAVKNTDDVWTIQRIIQWSTSYLKDRNITESPRLEAELLLAHALGCKRIQLYTSFDKPVTALEREPFKQSLKRRLAGEPVSYITGERDFMSMTFKVSPSVLIPRPDTEALVETVTDLLKGREQEELKILDIGTGSGCVGISLAKHFPISTVSAWDISEEALAIARENASKLGAANIIFTNCDALNDESWKNVAADGSMFDVIVSNPPYIAQSERCDLSASVLDFEPHLALFAELNGLIFYRQFAERAKSMLKPGGFIVVEIGYRQAKHVSELFAGNDWRNVRVVKDLGKNDRVVIAEH
jgi:release factor glutamine methyltransferase